MNSFGSIQIIAITSGKGGVGKTTISISLSSALASLGRRVMLMDGDLGLAKIDVLLGMTPGKTIYDVIKGDCTLKEILVSGPEGVLIVPAAPGIQDMVRLKPAQYAGLIHAFDDVAREIDVLIVDTAAGIGNSVINFSHAANEVIIVICDEPASLVDAYSLIKLLNRQHGPIKFKIIVNMVRSLTEGPKAFAKLNNAANLFLGVSLIYAGSLPYDEFVRKAMEKRVAIFQAYPNSKYSLAVQKIARAINKWPLPENPKGRLEFFFEYFMNKARKV